MMSHHWNNIAYESRQELYWESYDKLIAEGYNASKAEDKAMEIIERDIENGLARRYLLT